MFLRRRAPLVADPVALHPAVQPRFPCEADQSMLALMLALVFPTDASAECGGAIVTLPSELLAAAMLSFLLMAWSWIDVVGASRV